MNASAVNPQPSAFGTNELTTQLVLRLVDDDELLACGCVCKLLGVPVDDARDGNILRAAASPDISPWHVDTAHGDNDVIARSGGRCVIHGSYIPLNRVQSWR